LLGHSQLESIKKKLPIITFKRFEQSMLSVLMFTDDRAFRLALSGSLEGENESGNIFVVSFP